MLFRPAIVGLAALAAIVGALQYWPNFVSVLSAPDPPAGWAPTVAAFWFDTTKADWRESMVLGIRAGQVSDRLAMWWFDARQQFGVVGLVIAAVGTVRLWSLSPPWGVLVLSAFGVTTLFALTYNVGDSHVFFLPAHFLAALCAGVAVRFPPTAGGRLAAAGAEGTPLRLARIVVACAAVLYCGWRGWSTWPAVDRHDDRRGEQLIARLTLGIGDPDAVLVTQMNWQIENVLLYVARHRRKDLTWTRLGDVLPHFPFLVADQREIGREIVLTADAAANVVSTYGSLFAISEDTLVPVLPLSAEVARIPAGVPYVMTLLTPPPDEEMDAKDVATALTSLTRGAVPPRTPRAFELIAGISGEQPAVYRSSDRPFTMSFQLLGEPFTVRMDSWLPSDTFRRPGFGHVLRGRDHIQILERGVNLVWIGRDGRASAPVYAASLFAPERRYRLLGAVSPAFARRPPTDP